MKQCSKCLETLRDEDFYVQRGVLTTDCKRCRRRSASEWLKSHRDQARATKRKWRAANPGREAIGQRERDREEYWQDPAAARRRLAEYNQGLSAEQRRHRNERRAAEYRETPKVKARLAVLRALRLGELMRPETCSECGGPGQRIEAHHE